MSERTAAAAVQHGLSKGEVLPNSLPGRAVHCSNNAVLTRYSSLSALTGKQWKTGLPKAAQIYGWPMYGPQATQYHLLPNGKKPMNIICLFGNMRRPSLAVGRLISAHTAVVM